MNSKLILTGALLLASLSPALPAMPLAALGTGWPGYERSQALSVAVDGNRAYVGTQYWLNYGTFLVLDVSNPAQPVLLSHLPIMADNVNELFVVSNRVYAARGYGGLSIIDVSDPAQPFITGTCDTASYAVGVFVKDNLAFVADDAGGLVIIDVSDPTQPVKVTQCSARNYTKGVSVSGNHAYLAGYYAGVTIMDVSTPANPVELGFSSMPVGLWRVVPAEPYAFVAASRDGLRVLDVSDPTNLMWTATFNTTAYDLALAGSRLYVGGNHDLQVFDVSVPAQLRLLGRCPTQASTGVLCANSNCVFLANGNAGLEIVNVSNPARPAYASRFDTYGMAWDVEIVGNLAFVADDEDGVQILDISNPAQPSRVGHFDSPTYTLRVQVIGSLAYVVDGHFGLRIVDVTDPAHPAQIGVCTNVGGLDLQVVGNYAYLAGGSGGMDIVDIRHPALPVRVGGSTAVGEANSLKVVGNYCFVAANGGTLTALDVSNPAQPKSVAALAIPGHACFLDVAGNYLYGAGAVVDISNPAQLVKVGRYNDWGGVKVANNHLFVAAYDTFNIYSVTNPAVPVLVASTNLAPWSWSYGVTVAGNCAFVANEELGMVGFSLPEDFITSPAITAPPADTAATAGATPTFAVSVTGQPPLSYQWFFNNAPIPGATNWVMRLPNVQPLQAGGYSVVISNVSGAVTSQVASLTVTNPLVILTTGTEAPALNPSNCFAFSFIPDLGARYAVEYVASLGETNWTTLTTVTGGGVCVRITDPAVVGASRFYRLRKL